MTSSDVWDRATAERYDRTSAEMFAPEVLEPAVDFLARLAEHGPVLELAIGTGRVAIPLVRRGISVHGIELSGPMVDRLRDKISESELPVTNAGGAGRVLPERGPGTWSPADASSASSGCPRSDAWRQARAWCR